jgi:hypothetical protein
MSKKLMQYLSLFELVYKLRNYRNFETFFSDIPARDGKISNLFYSVKCFTIEEQFVTDFAIYRRITLQ